MRLRLGTPRTRRLLSLSRPQLGLLFGASVAGIVSLACGLSLPVVTEHLVNDAIVARHGGRIVPYALLAVAIAGVRAFMNFLRRNLSGEASVRTEADLRVKLFAHLQGLPVSFHDSWQSGQLLARATGDLNTIRMFVGFAVVFLGFVALTAIGVLVAIGLHSPLIAVLALALAVPFLVIAVRFNFRMEDLSTESREGVGRVASVVAESAAGVRILKAFGVERDAIERLDRAATELRDINLDAVRRRALYVPILGLIPNLMLGVVLGVGGYQTISGRLSIGALVAITQYLYLLIVPMRYVGWMMAMAQQAAASSERVFEILETEPDIRNAAGAVELQAVEGEIRFEGVTFTYPGAAATALHDVTFTVRPGESVALVGATGSGKSTVASLIPRFVDPEHGTVRIDGRDVRSLTLESLRRQIGVVFDEPILFSATVAENVAFGRPDATRDEIVAATEAAGAHRFVQSLPDGYNTRIGEQGFSLSGGQRQRLALARALLMRPRILILDDPLSSVDVRTEAEIEANLVRLLGQRTTMIISHRASTVAMADRVILFDEGRVVAEGTHDELIATDERYRRVLAAEVHVEELTA